MQSLVLRKGASSDEEDIEYDQTVRISKAAPLSRVAREFLAGRFPEHTTHPFYEVKYTVVGNTEERPVERPWVLEDDPTVEEVAALLPPQEEALVLRYRFQEQPGVQKVMPWMRDRPEFRLEELEELRRPMVGGTEGFFVFHKYASLQFARQIHTAYMLVPKFRGECYRVTKTIQGAEVKADALEELLGCGVYVVDKRVSSLVYVGGLMNLTPEHMTLFTVVEDDWNMIKLELPQVQAVSVLEMNPWVTRGEEPSSRTSVMGHLQGTYLKDSASLVEKWKEAVLEWQGIVEALVEETAGARQRQLENTVEVMLWETQRLLSFFSSFKFLTGYSFDPPTLHTLMTKAVLFSCSALALLAVSPTPPKNSLIVLASDLLELFCSTRLSPVWSAGSRVINIETMSFDEQQLLCAVWALLLVLDAQVTTDPALKRDLLGSAYEKARRLGEDMPADPLSDITQAFVAHALLYSGVALGLDTHTLLKQDVEKSTPARALLQGDNWAGKVLGVVGQFMQGTVSAALPQSPLSTDDPLPLIFEEDKFLANYRSSGTRRVVCRKLNTLLKVEDEGGLLVIDPSLRAENLDSDTLTLFEDLDLGMYQPYTVQCVAKQNMHDFYLANRDWMASRGMSGAEEEVRYLQNCSNWVSVNGGKAVKTLSGLVSMFALSAFRRLTREDEEELALRTRTGQGPFYVYTALEAAAVMHKFSAEGVWEDRVFETLDREGGECCVVGSDGVVLRSGHGQSGWISLDYLTELSEEDEPIVALRLRLR